MSYVPQTWTNGVAGQTPVSASRMQYIEDGIEAVSTPISTPVYTGSRAGMWDSTTSIYNGGASTTFALRAKLAAGRAGSACRILWIGDSVTAGQGATPGSTDPVTALRKRWGLAGLTVGQLAWMTTGTTLDSRLTVGWDTVGDVSFPYAQKSTAGSTVVFTGTTAGTVLEILTTGSSARFTYRVDSGSTIAIPAASDPLAMQLVTVTGLADIVHTVTITSVAGSNFLAAVGIRAATGYSMLNAGVSGGDASDWDVSDWYAGQPAALGFDPDVVVIEVGINDLAGGATASTTAGHVQNLITRAVASGASVLLVASHAVTSAAISDANWSAYLSACYDLADTNAIPLLDLTDRIGRYARWGTVIGFDTYHFTATGYALKSIGYDDALHG